MSKENLDQKTAQQLKEILDSARNPNSAIIALADSFVARERQCDPWNFQGNHDPEMRKLVEEILARPDRLV